jgi:hypothetical protein
VLEQKLGVTAASHILIVGFIVLCNCQKKVYQLSWVVILQDIKFVFLWIDIDLSVTPALFSEMNTESIQVFI